MLAYATVKSRATHAIAAIVAAVVAGGAARASAQHLEGSARATGGWDSNPTLSTAAELRHGSMISTTPVASDGFGRLELGASGRLGRAPWALAGLDADARAYGSGDVRAWERLRARLGTRWRTIELALGAEGSRYDASGTEDASWTGRGGASAAWWPANAVSIELSASAGVRAYDVGGQVDGLGAVGLAVDATVGPFVLDAGIAFEHRGSTDAAAVRDELAPWVAVTLTLGRVEAHASYGAFARRFEDLLRDGVEHVAALTLRVRALSWLRAVAGAELGIARGDTNALVYDRMSFWGGIEVALAHEAGAVERDDAHDAEARQPAEAVPGGISFCFVLPGAHEVSVVGTFDDWDPAHGALRRVAGARFEGTLPAAPGHHRFHLVVDGQPMRPPGAARYAPDDFGGEDAVVVVPQSVP